MALLRTRRPAGRPAAAAVELALVLPFLAFLAVIGIDFARLFHTSVILGNCARNGALYESDAYNKAESPYPTVREAALADAPELKNPSPTVTTDSGVDPTGQAYVAVTVTHHFRTIVSYPLVPDSVQLSRTVRMNRAPMNPTN